MTYTKIAELAEWLGVTRAAVYGMCQNGRLPAKTGDGVPTDKLIPALCNIIRKQPAADKGKAKDRLVEAQAALAELKFKRASKDVLDRHAVTLVVQGLAIELRRVLQGMDIDRETKERISKQLATVEPAQLLARIEADLAEEEAPTDDEE